jgi:hypothetical protein
MNGFVADPSYKSHAEQETPISDWYMLWWDDGVVCFSRCCVRVVFLVCTCPPLGVYVCVLARVAAGLVQPPEMIDWDWMRTSVCACVCPRERRTPTTLPIMSTLASTFAVFDK